VSGTFFGVRLQLWPAGEDHRVARAVRVVDVPAADVDLVLRILRDLVGLADRVERETPTSLAALWFPGHRPAGEDAHGYRFRPPRRGLWRIA
jgi:hypothetical protein